MSDTNTAVALSPSAVLSMAPGANLGAYVQTVSAIPILSIERERELAERLFYENCVDSARELVLAHLRFVVHVARSYSGYGLQEADLIQEGNVGLMKAVKRFDPTKGVRLVSFAVHWIKAEMHEYILKIGVSSKWLRLKRSASCSLICVARKRVRIGSPKPRL